MANLKVNLEDVTLNNSRVYGRLLEYMSRLMSYDYFDVNQEVRVYVDEVKDFIAFESLQFRVQFTSNDKKLVSLIMSPYEPLVCSFKELLRAMQQLAC